MIKKVKDIFSQGVIRDNLVFRQILGICSALAVTNLMLNSLAMGLGLIFVSSLSSLTVSLLRRHTPGHIRMMVQVLIISAYVIIVDIVLKAYFPALSSALGMWDSSLRIALSWGAVRHMRKTIRRWRPS